MMTLERAIFLFYILLGFSLGGYLWWYLRKINRRSKTEVENIPINEPPISVSEELKQQVSDLIRKNRIEKALGKLQEAWPNGNNELVILEKRLEESKQAMLIGDYGEGKRERNRIAMHILEYLK